MKIIYGSRRRLGNTLITRGLGPYPASAMLTYGFITIIQDTITKIVHVGQSGTKRAAERLRQLAVWAKLLKVNEESVGQLLIQGSSVANIDESLLGTIKGVSFVSSNIVESIDRIKISAKRIK